MYSDLLDIDLGNFSLRAGGPWLFTKCHRQKSFCLQRHRGRVGHPFVFSTTEFDITRQFARAINLALYSWVRSRGKGFRCRHKSHKTPPNSRQCRTKSLYSDAKRADEQVRQASRFNMNTLSWLSRIHPAPPFETMATVSSRDPGSWQRIKFFKFSRLIDTMWHGVKSVTWRDMPGKTRLLPGSEVLLGCTTYRHIKIPAPDLYASEGTVHRAFC